MPSRDPLQDTALEHLRVIRTLMERASIYRSVSAPAALGGGVLSLGVAAFVYWCNHATDGAVGGTFVLLLWYGVLIVTGISNMILLMREAGLRGERPFSDSMRMALRGLVPPMLTGGILGSYLIWTGSNAALGAIVWILCYGLALQATVSFAPRSIILLARAFLITGQLMILHYVVKNYSLGPFQRAAAEFPQWSGGSLFVDPAQFIALFKQQSITASVFLGLTFGLYHIIYAVCVFASKPRPVENDAVTAA